MIRIEALSKVKRNKQAGEKKVLKGIDLEIRTWEFSVLIGPSGGGQEHPAAPNQPS